ncbi:MAG: N-acetyl-gamma-glutamyl-phosphate reductase [Streptosporangiaceae bacterium]|nr:N-acetyl-gamma-glutamyl-phosphate reductase [Streptosporangiaceae bacterium]MBV9856284.1 N-acetyl-gamma-glutamyl-phosphate reductase [Streptosporangiaceae bacterium]
MGVCVAVAGASGYAGGELLRLLAGHPGLEIGPVTAGSNAGKPVTAVHPQLTGNAALDGREFSGTDPDLLAGAELLFLALPHGESAALAARMPHARMVDLGADFRLADAAQWEKFYGTPHAGRWTYGLPELPGARAAIAGATRVAAPGCYATAAILALAPLLAAGLVEPADIVVAAASGTSGAGRTPKPELLGSEVMGAMSAYKVGGTHRHTPEIEQALGEVHNQFTERNVASPQGPVTVSFTPALAPMPRGILATCTARLAGSASGPAAALRGAFADAYAGEPFVHLLPEGQWPSTGPVAGSNAAHLQVTADTHTGRAVVVAAIDNLGKGAAGQAVQIANLMLGLPETAGLTPHGVAP